MYYTQKNIKKQYKNCTPFNRCNNYKSCPHCSTAYRKREFSKATKHLHENDIKQYKNKYYIVFTSNDLKISTYEKNKYIDLFMTEFLAKKRNKNFIINKSSQYFITKEISYNKKYDDYNPHYNFILLSNDIIDFENKQFKRLLENYNIKFHIEKIYKSDNSYKKSIEKIINYSLKFDENRARLENDISISKYKRNIYKSDLFNSEKYANLRKRLCIHIQATKEHYNNKIKQAKSILKRNLNKKHKKRYIILLKSYHKKVKYYNSVKARHIKRLKDRFRLKKLIYFDSLSKA